MTQVGCVEANELPERRHRDRRELRRVEGVDLVIDRPAVEDQRLALVDQSDRAYVVLRCLDPPKQDITRNQARP